MLKYWDADAESSYNDYYRGARRTIESKVSGYHHGAFNMAADEFNAMGEIDAGQSVPENARQDEELTMLDTTLVTTAITRLISTGTTEQAPLAAVASRFPELTPAELSQALQVATTAAERKVAARH